MSLRNALGSLAAVALIAIVGSLWLVSEPAAQEPLDTVPGRRVPRAAQPTPPGAKVPARKARQVANGIEEAPLEALQVLLDGYHYRDGHVDEQMAAVHYCSQLNPDLVQCALFDGKGAKARLIGVEYVLSERLARRLPEDERALWHSHAFEVKSGMLAAPGMDPKAEHALMSKLVGTYGKTWHTWATDMGDALPLGRPTLMMAFTREGQARPELIEARTREIGVSTEELARRRADIRAPKLVDGVDEGEEGMSCVPSTTRRVRGRRP